ncbi:MAG: sigma-70 family RNA polymerase sigma factor [bacterium]
MKAPRPEGGLMEFGELVKKFSPRIRHLAAKSAPYIRGIIDKDDLFQEMLYHLWERWRKGELEGKNEAYIMGSCYFHLKNYLRRYKEKAKVVSLNEPLGEDGISLEELIVGQTPLFEEKVDDMLFIRQMKEKELTRREEEVAELLSQDYTVRAISQKLGISHVRVIQIKENIGKKFKKGGYQKG